MAKLFTYVYPVVMVVVFIAVAVAVLYVGIDRTPCVVPPVEYRKAEKVMHIPTAEEVRVVAKWSPKCRGVTRTYTVRFSDGAEVSVGWEELKRRRVQ